MCTQHTRFVCFFCLPRAGAAPAPAATGGTGRAALHVPVGGTVPPRRLRGVGRGVPQPGALSRGRWWCTPTRSAVEGLVLVYPNPERCRGVGRGVPQPAVWEEPLWDRQSARPNGKFAPCCKSLFPAAYEEIKALVAILCRSPAVDQADLWLFTGHHGGL